MPGKEKRGKRKNSFLSWILFLANLAVLGFMLPGFLAAYVPPDKFWMLAFAGLAFPYFALLNFIFLVFWILLKKRFAFVSLAFVLLSWGRMAGFYQISLPDKVTKTERSLKVVSYNVRIFDRYNWKSGKISEDAREILKLTGTLQPDVLCLQEYHSGGKGKTSMCDSIKKYTGLKHSHIEFIKVNGTARPFGIATFSRWPVVKTETIKFSNNRLNLCIVNDLLCFNDTIRVFNLHLESIKFSNEDYLYMSDIANQAEDQELFKKNSLKIFSKLRKAFIARASQAREVAELIRKSPHPVIVCGDFNDTPSSYSYHTIAEGLNDAFRDSGNGFGQTYAGIFPSFRIDYILYGDELESTDFTRIKESHSDHYPIAATLRLRNN